MLVLLILVTVGCNEQENTDKVSLEKANEFKHEEVTTSESKRPVNKNPELVSGESNSATTSSLDQAQAEQLNELDSATTEDQPTKTSKSIVADAGFSGSTSTLADQPAETYCVSQNNTSDYSVEEACASISQRLASVSMQSCSNATLAPTGCNSNKGFPILMREFAPIDDKKPQGRILLIGGTHGDELTSVSVTFKWIEKLNKHHSGLFHWHITPLMNPDGLLKKAATRTNHNGVDLNRNMPSDDWNRNALNYWKERGRKDPRKYPGASAASEPETQWLIDEINLFKPDAIISVHAPYGVVDFDALLLNTAPKSLGKLRLNLLGTYPGSLGNYAGINRDIPVITLELPHSWVMLSDSETSRIWEDIVSWLSNNIDNRSPKKQTADAH